MIQFLGKTQSRGRYVLYLGLALLLGGLFTWMAWPGIFYSDSYGRWFMARELTRLNFALQDDWLSVPPQLFMAVLYKLTHSYGSFTFLQSTAFYFTLFCAVDCFVPYGKIPTLVLAVLFPVFYGFSVYVEMSVGSLIALLWLFMLLFQYDHSGLAQKKPLQKILYFLVCLFLYFVLLGFRQNAFTVLPVLAFGLWMLGRQIKSYMPLVLHGAAVALSMAVIALLPSLLHFGFQNGGGSLATGFLWETVSILQELGDDPRYNHMLDYLGQEGTTAQAVENNHYDSIYGYHDAIPNTVVGTGNHKQRILQDYFRLMREQPRAFWTVKARFISRALGISQPLSVGEYDYDRDGRMQEFGFSDKPQRRLFYDSYKGFMEGAAVLRRPWLLFLAAGALLGLAARWLASRDFYKLGLLYLAAVFFYGSFLITTQSQEFRYFFVPLVLLYLVSAGSLGALCKAAAGYKTAKSGRDAAQEESD